MLRWWRNWYAEHSGPYLTTVFAGLTVLIVGAIVGVAIDALGGGDGDDPGGPDGSRGTTTTQPERPRPPRADRDNDGVPDKSDGCPNQVGVAPDGCPKPAPSPCDVVMPPPLTGDGPFEPNDDLSEARFGIASGGARAAKLEAARDEDWYALCSGAVGRRLYVRVVNKADDTETSCTLEVMLLDEKGNPDEPLAQDTADTYARRVRVTGKLKPNSLYFVRVAGYTGSACPDEYAPYPYTISAQPADALTR